MDLSKYWTLGKIADVCRGRLLSGDAAKPVASISIDSRKVNKGELFWVIEGASKDGNDFVHDAMAAGAMGALISHPPSRPIPGTFPMILTRRGLEALRLMAGAHRNLFPRLTAVSVTGSNGKTTTKELISKIFSKAGPVCSTLGNFNNEIGCPLSVLELQEKHRFAVWEMAARRKGDIAPLSLMAKPQIVVLTNIASAHLETFGSQEVIFETKSEILQGLQPGGQVIYWRDDPWLSRLPQIWPGCAYVSFGLEPGADVTGRMISQDQKGTLLEISYQEKVLGQTPLAMTALGPIKNVLAATACALVAGIASKKILQALAEFIPVALRGEKVILSPSLGEQFVAINDAYNANPDSMQDSVLGFLRGYRQGTRVVVLGEMRELGEKELEIHEQTGIEIARLAKEAKLLDERVAFVITGRQGAERLALGLNRELGRLGPKVLFSTRAQSLDIIKKYLFSFPPPGAVFFKASRAEALEELIEDLKREF